MIKNLEKVEVSLNKVHILILFEQKHFFISLIFWIRSSLIAKDLKAHLIMLKQMLLFTVNIFFINSTI